jgi:hypothetical protein
MDTARIPSRNHTTARSGAILEWHLFDQDELNHEAWENALLPPSSEAKVTAHRRTIHKPASIAQWWKELALLSLFLAAFIGSRVWRSEYPAASPTPHELQNITLVTTLFPFDDQRQDASAVDVFVADIDHLYAELRRDFGLPSLEAKRKLTVDIGLTSPSSAGVLQLILDTNTVSVPLGALPSPLKAGKRNELTAYLENWLAGHLLDEAVKRTVTRPVWQPMINGLHHYFWLRQNNRNLRLPEDELTAAWPLVPSFTLNTTFMEDIGYPPNSSGSSNHTNSVDSLDIPTTLADYLISTYGRGHLAALVHGFGLYDSWETLSPAVFGVPASELEAGWHRYLKALASSLAPKR